MKKGDEKGNIGTVFKDSDAMKMTNDFVKRVTIGGWKLDTLHILAEIPGSFRRIGWKN